MTEIDMTTKLLRECDAHLTTVDGEIAEKKHELKMLRESREKTIRRMRDIIHGEQPLPFDAADATHCEHGVDVAEDTCEACEAQAQADTAAVVNDLASRVVTPADIQAVAAQRGRAARAAKNRGRR